MSKALKTAAIIVGAVALIATGVGAAAGAGLLGATTLAAGASAATVATLATVATVASIASVAAGVLSLAAGLTAKKPSTAATGSQTSFSADPDAGIPYVIGRTGTAGNIVYRAGFDTRDAGDNDRQSFVSALSLGPVKSVGSFQADRSSVNFTATGAAIGAFAGFMWSMTQIGALASPALGFGAGAGTPPTWTAQHKLSGLAAASWTLRFDTKSKLYQNGVPAPMWVVEGGLAYDPRKDSTYPGGSGPHRMADPADRAAYDAAVATWEYTENPYLHGLKWVHGIWQRDTSKATSNWQRVMGMGAQAAGIDVAAFVDGANVADATGWKVGGVIFSGDAKWETLKKILQAGMGEPLALGARMSCLVNAPKVSLATVTIDDVIGDASVGATQPRRDRINTITPKWRLEVNNWQHLPGAPISVAEHVVTDRGKRSKVQDYWFIQQTGQVGTAVRYDIENAREFGPIVLPLKLFWMGYRPGDCVTANLPELGLNSQPILLLNRELDPSGGVVTMTARSETPAKHAYALGQTATPPPTPGVTGAALVPVPRDGSWAITATSVTSEGVTLPALVVTGAIDAGTPDAIVFEYRPYKSGQAVEAGWLSAGIEPVTATTKAILGVQAGAAYEVAVSYRARGVVGDRRLVGPVTTASYGGLGGGGEGGQNGKDGAPGKDGVDGRTSYVHFAYANSPDGRIDFSVGIPGGRAFVGSYTDFTAADSADPAAYTWSAYKGPASFGLTARGNSVVASNALVNTAAGGWGSGGGYSTEGWKGGAQTAFRLDGNSFGGLNTDPSADDSYGSIDYSFHHSSDGYTYIFENGANIQRIGLNDPTRRFQIIYDNATVSYLINGELVRQVARPADLTFYFDAALAEIVGGRVSDITFMAASSRARDGIDGTNGAPGERGTDGRTSYVHYAYANSPDGRIDFDLNQPNGRAYEGSYTDFAAADSADPAAYVWREYKGPPFGMAARGYAIIAGTSVIKNGGPEAWDSDAYSTVGFNNGCYVAFTGQGDDADYFMVGLNTDPTADASYLSLDFAWFLFPDGGARIYENGEAIYNGSNVNWVAGYGAGNFRLEYDGRYVRYLFNDNVYRTVDVGPGRTFYFDSSLARPDRAIRNIQFGSMGKAGSDGRDGTNGAPGRPGADGRTSYTHYAYANAPDGRVDFDLNQPDGRAYEGSYTDFTAADSVDPAAYVWREYKGPPFGLAVTGPAALAGDQVIKTGGGYAWNAQAYSTVGFRDGAQCSFTSGVPERSFMAGLNTDPTANADWDTLDFAWYTLDGQNRAFITESGTPGVAGVDIRDFGSGTFQVVYDNRYVRYLYNGVVYREVDVGPGKLFYFDSSLLAPGARIQNIAFGSAGARGADGRDGVNGTNGVNGRDGVNGGSAYFHVAYANSADGSADFTTGEPGARTYLGIAVDQSAADPGDFRAYSWSLIKGRDGLNGSDGTPGARGADGQQSYVHFAYANSADGSVAFSTDDPSGRAYIGVYSDFTLADSGDYRSYTWSLAKGSDGTNGTNGANGTDGFIADTETTVFAIECYSSGAPKPTWGGGAGTISLRKGASIITAGVSYSIGAQQNMASLTLNANGFSFAGITADTGYFVINAVLGGVAYSRVINVKKVKDGSAAFRGSVALSGRSSIGNGALNLGEGKTPIPGGSTVVVSAYVDYTPPQTGNQSGDWRGTLSLYYQNVTDGGPSVLLGSRQGSLAYRHNIGSAQEPEIEEQAGTVSASFSFPSAAADKIYAYSAVMTGSPGSNPYQIGFTGTLKTEVAG